MASTPRRDMNQRQKAQALSDSGTLNPTPERVRDPKFAAGEFFDPRDLVQVKYEMLRSVLAESASVTHAAQEYGFSRPTFYQARSSFRAVGLSGLVPKKPGPRGRHKLSPRILEFLRRSVPPGRPIRARHLAKLVFREFGLTVHPRTIERALEQKKTLR